MRSGNEPFNILQDSSDPDALPQLERAMAWLTRGEGSSIGLPLLDAARKNAGRPIQMMVNPYGGDTGYNPATAILNINPQSYEEANFVDAAGNYYAPSIESILAHELVHAGQSADLYDVHVEAKEAYQKMLIARAKRFKDGEALFNAVLDAPDKTIEAQRIAEYVDNVVQPAEKQLLEDRRNNVTYQRYLHEVEAPAIAAEAQVAQLQGGPQRVSHNTYDDLSPEQLREQLIDRTEKHAQIKRHERDIKQRSGLSFADQLRNHLVARS